MHGLQGHASQHDEPTCWEGRIPTQHPTNRLPKHLPDHTRRFADVLVHNRAGYDLEEVCINVGRNCSSKQGLASPLKSRAQQLTCDLQHRFDLRTQF